MVTNLFFRYVSKEVRKKYGLEDLSLRNTWKYTLTPKEWGKDEASGKEDKGEDLCAGEQQMPAAKGLNVNLITKFTKVLTEEEMGRKKAVDTPKPSSSGVATEVEGKTAQEGERRTPTSRCSKGVKKTTPRRSLLGGADGPETSPIVALFKRAEEKKAKRSSPNASSPSSKKESASDQDECIVLE